MSAINLKSGSKGVIVLIAVAVVIFLVCCSGYYLAAGKMKTAADELAEKEKNVKESTQIALKLEKSKLDYQDTLSQIRFLETGVATEAYVPTLLKQMEALGKSVNLKVTSVTPSQEQQKSSPRKLTSGADAAQGNVDKASEESKAEVKKKPAEPPYDKLKIAIDFEGSYSNTLDFLYKLTSFPKILAVSSIAVTPRDSELARLRTPVLKVSLVVTAFVLRKDDPVESPEKSLPSVPAVSNSASGGSSKNEAG